VQLFVAPLTAVGAVASGVVCTLSRRNEASIRPAISGLLNASGMLAMLLIPGAALNGLLCLLFTCVAGADLVLLLGGAVTGGCHGLVGRLDHAHRGLCAAAMTAMLVPPPWISAHAMTTHAMTLSGPHALTVAVFSMAAIGAAVLHHATALNHATVKKPATQPCRRRFMPPAAGLSLLSETALGLSLLAAAAAAL
jgi:hypothetical protein